MHAVRLHAFGGPEVLQYESVPGPVVGPQDVLIEVAACGVCHHDLLTRRGAFPGVPLPATLGHQVAGRVAAVGPEVRHLGVGDPVITLTYIGCGECAACLGAMETRCERRARFLGEDLPGGYAERVAVPGRGVLRLPRGIDFERAAVLNCTAGTAYHAVVMRGQVRFGETVLVTGASGGVGSEAVRLLRAMGARALAVTTTAAKAEGIERAGADHVIVSPGLKFAREIKVLTGGRGADVVIEVVGSPTLGESVHSLAQGGRLVVVGNVTGGSAELSPALLILKEISLIGTKSITAAEMANVVAWVADGRLAAEVERTLPLERAAEAHRLLEERALSGRVVLVTKS